MATNDSLDYYAGRAEQARSLAEHADLPEVRKIHLDMAARYSRLSTLGATERPTLSIVPGGR